MKLKKSISALLAACTALAAVPAAVYADDIKVYVDNSKVSFTDQSPVIIDDRTMVPIRAVFEAAGASVDWNSDTKTATLKRNDYTVIMQLYEPYFYKNGEPIALDVPSQLVNDRIVIPVRAIAEAMDFGVTWDSAHRNVLIATDGKAYRANGQWETGFRDINDCGIMLSYEFHNLQIDLDGDGNEEMLSFTPKTDETPAYFSINGADYSAILPDSANGIRSMGFVNVCRKDVYTEIVAVDPSDVSSAYFFRYNGMDLAMLKSNSSQDGSIPFINKLFFDGVENIISDLDGLCFTSLMICPGIYSLEDSKINRYVLDTSNAPGLSVSVTYNDQMTYWIKYTDSYQRGQYVAGNIDADGSVSADAFPNNRFKIDSIYFDEVDPAKFEIYVEFPNGQKAVFWPFNV